MCLLMIFTSSLPLMCSMFNAEILITSKTNIAYKKTVYMSTYFYPDKKTTSATDGITTKKIENCIYTRANLKQASWLVVDLTKKYYIDHIFVYGGEYNSGSLDYVIVGLLDIFEPSLYTLYNMSFTLCDVYKFRGSFRNPLEIICRPESPTARYVILLQSSINLNYLEVCEIEIFAKYDEHLYGCYELSTNLITFNDSVNVNTNVELCISLCYKYNYTFAGLHIDPGGRIDCSCGDRLEKSLNYADCEFAKDTNSTRIEFISRKQGVLIFTVCPLGFHGVGCENVCHCVDHVPCDFITGFCSNGYDLRFTGGMSDYKMKPYQILGCKKDDNQKDFPYVREFYDNQEVTIGFCSEKCLQMGLPYAIVLEFRKCGCGYAISLTDQDIEYLKENRLSCTNEISFVCPVGTFGYKCARNCNCQNDIFVIGGKQYTFCPENSCKAGCLPGWTGHMCSQRNCLDANGACSNSEKCSQMSKTITKCQVIESFSSTNLGVKILIAFITVALVIIVILLVWLSKKKLNKMRKKTCNNNSSNQDSINNNTKESNYTSYSEDIKFKRNTLNSRNIQQIEQIAFLQIGNNEITKLNNSNVLSRNILAEYVKQNLSKLEEEFKSIPKQTAASCDHAKLKKYKEKNRFQNIFPYDYNRVCLRNGPSDYVNASHVTGYGIKVIASQGPNEKTTNDFWQMIAENNVQLIVMLCNLEENGKAKCDRYWPDVNLKSTKKGEIKITLIKETNWQDYIVREMFVEDNKGSTINLIQLQYLKWPDQGIPSNAVGFLEFTNRFETISQTNNIESCLVHCSAGVGRTGCFLALISLLEKSRSGQLINVPLTISALREERPFMVQKPSQYLFVYSTLILEASIGQTCFSSEDFQAQFSEKLKLIPNTDCDLMNKLKAQNDIINQADEMLPTKALERKSKTEISLKNTHLYEINYLMSTLKFTYSHDAFDWVNLPKDCDTVIIIDQQNSIHNITNEKTDNIFQDKDLTVTLKEKIFKTYGTKIEIELKTSQVIYDNVGSTLYENIASTTNSIKKITLYLTNDDYTINCINKGHIISLYDDLIQNQITFNTIWINSNNNSSTNPCAYLIAIFNCFQMISIRQEISIFMNAAEIRKVDSAFEMDLESYIQLHRLVLDYLNYKVNKIKN